MRGLGSVNGVAARIVEVLSGAATFALAANDYAAARPTYPESLFDWLANTAPGRDRAWDCGTGNGQAALALSRRFVHVDATDISLEQVEQGFAAPNIAYAALPAERTAFPDTTFDLVTVAQALHWFDYERFWPEVRRVARPGALFCAWGYAWFRGDAAVEQALLDPVMACVAPFWAANNCILWDGYADADIRFPFRRLATPELRIDVRWNAEEVAAYLRTWSAFKRAAAAGHGPELERLIATGVAALGPTKRFDLWVPLAIVAGFVD